MVQITPHSHIQGASLWRGWHHWMGAECHRIPQTTGMLKGCLVADLMIISYIKIPLIYANLLNNFVYRY